MPDADLAKLADDELTALGAGMTIWAGLDFSRDANHLRRLRFQTRALHRRAEAVQAILAEIEDLLTHRLGPP